MKQYIFLTFEGHTFQPDSESEEQDIENLQVIGFSSGLNQEDAFKNLIKESEYLMKTKFDEIFCYHLGDNYKDSKRYFYLSDNKKENSA